MVIECCSQERTYLKFFGLIGERFAKLNRLWTELFENSFRTYYETIHRYETNRLRNIAKFFGHMLASDALGWHVFSTIHLNEEETTASSRIFIKILFQDLAEEMGMKKLTTRLKDPYLQEAYLGIFPKDNPRNTRFSINYFTSIGMGPITEDMRQHLQASVAQQQAALEAAAAAKAAEESDSESVSSYSSYSSRSTRSGGSRSRSRSRSRGRDRSRSHTRSDSRSRSRSRSYSRSRSRSRSPAARGSRRGRSYSRSVSRSRSRSYSRSVSRSRSRTPDDRGRRRARSYSSSRSRSRGGRSYSRSRSRSYSSSRSRSRSRKPAKLGRPPVTARDRSPVRRSRTPPRGKRARSDSRSVSRTPVKREK